MKDISKDWSKDREFFEAIDSEEKYEQMLKRFYEIRFNSLLLTILLVVFIAIFGMFCIVSKNIKDIEAVVVVLIFLLLFFAVAFIGMHFDLKIKLLKYMWRQQRNKEMKTTEHP